MENQDVLDEIRRSQHQTEILLTEIKGDNKLQSQVLAFHVQQLLEFKEEHKENREEIEGRVKKLESWQIRVIGIATGAAAIVSFVLNDIKDALLK